MSRPVRFDGESPPGLPNRLPRPDGELARLERAWATPPGWRFFSTVNNTNVGLLYLGTALLFFVLAGVLGLLMRAQLAVPGNDLLGPDTYNQVFTMHGTVMMFLFAVPAVEAVAVYLLPGMLGARDLPFPRLSAYAYWTYAFGGLAFFVTIFFGVAPDGGWFMYPPLTGKTYSPGVNTDFWLLGIGFIEISAIAGAIELIIGILFTRAPGMTLARMPIFAWAMLVVCVMIVFAFPAVIAGTALLELERAFDWPFFIAERGGDPLVWQHLFWFFGHPEVYIIFLPAAGMVSMMVPALAGTPLVGHRAIVLALLAVGFFSFGLWAHHMFTAGLATLSMSFVSAASLAVAIPSGIQVFAWLATLWRGRVRPNAPTLFLFGFLFIFVLGGLTGVMVAVLPFDWQAHDTYFIVAHLHYVLIGGMVFPLFAAMYYWMPLLRGQRLSERWARWIFGLMFGGFNLAFFPMHIAGLAGMPRRVYTYAPENGWGLLNLLSSLGALVLACGVLLFFVDMARMLRRPARIPGNPWNAPTLEWLPSGPYGARSIPRVESREPLWTHPRLAAEAQAGAHWLPYTHSGRRETLVTTPIGARLRYLLVLPGDSWLPLLAAFGTAGFFLLLTVGWMWLSGACLVLAIAAIMMWLWQTDHLPHAPRADIGEGCHVPVGGVGRDAHSYWAMVVLLFVDASIFASIVFTYLHVSMVVSAVCPPPGVELPAAAWPALAALSWLAGSACMAWARHGARGAGQRGRLLAGCPAALLFLLAGMGAELAGHAQAGLAPRETAWAAGVAAMLGYQGLHAAILVLMGAYVWARAWNGLVDGDRRASYDNTALLWHYVTAQGLAMLALVHLFPRWVD